MRIWIMIHTIVTKMTAFLMMNMVLTMMNQMAMKIKKVLRFMLAEIQLIWTKLVWPMQVIKVEFLLIIEEI
jgi:hypothetical protein